jgi:hypothetical protein
MILQLVRSFVRCALAFLLFLIFAAQSASIARASIIVNLLVDPATTAGAGSNSNLSGPGTWQFYAVDDNSSNFGISSFNVNLKVASGVMTATNRSPLSSYDSDGSGNPILAGFADFHQALGNNTASVQLTGSQPLQPSANSSGDVGFDYFPISGFGQTASSFATKYPNTILGPTIGSSWGTYSSPSVAPFSGATGNRNWVFLGEGTYTASAPSFLSGTVTLYTNFSTSFQSAGPFNMIAIPEPATAALAMLTFAVFVRRRRRARAIYAHTARRRCDQFARLQKSKVAKLSRC